MIGPTYLLHPSPAPHFKTFHLFLICCPDRPSFSRAMLQTWHFISFFLKLTSNLLVKRFLCIYIYTHTNTHKNMWRYIYIYMKLYINVKTRSRSHGFCYIVWNDCKPVAGSSYLPWLRLGMYGTPLYVRLCASPGSTPHLKIPGWRSLQYRLIQ